jgi:O-antigen/teichoic acid export membrane protein
LALGLHLSGLSVGLAAMAAGGVASLLTVRSDLVRRGGFRQLRRHWQLGRWLVSESFLYSVTIYGIWAFVIPRAGASVAGQLRAAQQLFVPVQTVIAGLNTVLLARFARHHGRSRSRALGVLQVALTGAWGALLIGLGPWVTSLLFGPAFHLSRWNLAVFTAALMAAAYLDLSALRLRATRNVRPLITARVATSVVALGGAILVGSSFIGVAASFLASQLVGACFIARATPERSGLSQ